MDLNHPAASRERNLNRLGHDAVDVNHRQTNCEQNESEPMSQKAAAARITGQNVKLYDGQGRNLCSITALHAKSGVAIMTR